MAEPQFNSLEDALGAVVDNSPNISASEAESDSSAPVEGSPPETSPEVEAGSDSASDAEAETEIEAAETEVDPEADTEPEPPPPPQERLGRIAKRLRDERRTVAKEMEEIRRIKTELEGLRSAANPWAEVAELAKKDPIAGLERFAEISGTTTAAVLEKYARAAIGKPEDPKDAVSQMRQELEAFKASLRQREEADLKRQQQVQLQQHIDSGVEELMQIQKPEYSSKYPYASALDPADLRNEFRSAIQYLVDNNMALPATEVAEVVEKKIARLVKPIINRHAPGNGKKPVATSPLSAPMKKPTLTNQDAAGTVPGKAMTDEERIRQAAEAIGKGVTF